MSSAGRAASISDCVVRPRARAIGLIGFAVQTQRSSLTGSYVMETAEHREPCESRGSRTVLGARGGEIPPRDSTDSALLGNVQLEGPSLVSGPQRITLRCRRGGDVPVDVEISGAALLALS